MEGAQRFNEKVCGNEQGRAGTGDRPAAGASGADGGNSAYPAEGRTEVTVFEIGIQYIFFGKQA